jgi:hypothetical protein
MSDFQRQAGRIMKLLSRQSSALICVTIGTLGVQAAAAGAEKRANLLLFLPKLPDPSPPVALAVT